MYPKWLPSFKAFGQALLLSLEFIPVVIIGGVFIFPLEYIPRTKTGWYVGLTLIALSVLAMIYALSMIHQFLWDMPREKVRWFPRWRCLGEGVWGVTTIFISTLIGAVFTLIIYDRPSQSEFERTLPVIGIIVLAYFHHGRNLWFTPKNKDVNKSKKVNEVERELNGLKADEGIKKMNDIYKD